MSRDGDQMRNLGIHTEKRTPLKMRQKHMKNVRGGPLKVYGQAVSNMDLMDFQRKIERTLQM